MESSRTCAACRKVIPHEAVRKCSKCHRRAYCGKECQAKDWTPRRSNGELQGHQSWCGLEYGEEGLDWAIFKSPGRGKGIMALRDIPAGYRIMVDLFDPKEHIQGPGKNPGQLVNHDCNPNSFKSVDPACKVNIILSKREIKSGEEITYSYMGRTDTHIRTPYAIFFGLPPTERMIESSEDCRDILMHKYGISCPSDCVCFNKEAEAKINKERKMYDMILVDKMDYTDSKFFCFDLRLVELLCEDDRMINGPMAQYRVLEKGFKVAAQRRSTLEKGLKWLEKSYEISCTLFHPKFSIPRRLKGWLEKPETFNKYLAADDLKIQKGVEDSFAKLGVDKMLTIFGKFETAIKRR